MTIDTINIVDTTFKSKVYGDSLDIPTWVNEEKEDKKEVSAPILVDKKDDDDITIGDIVDGILVVLFGPMLFLFLSLFTH